MKKKLSKELSAGTKVDSSTKADGMQVSPANAKPNVIGGQVEMSTEIGIDEYLRPLGTKGGKVVCRLRPFNSG